MSSPYFCSLMLCCWEVGGRAGGKGKAGHLCPWPIIKFYDHWLLKILLTQMLREDPVYPKALIGRGTTHAFQ